MSYLKLEYGDPVNLTILSDRFGERQRHWVGGKFHDCTFPDCQLCNTGYERRIEKIVQVSVGDEEKTWTVGKLTAEAIEIISPNIKGLDLTVTLTKKDGKNRVDIVPMTKAFQGIPDPETSSDSVFLVNTILNELQEYHDSLKRMMGLIVAVIFDLSKLRDDLEK